MEPARIIASLDAVAAYVAADGPEPGSRAQVRAACAMLRALAAQLSPIDQPVLPEVPAAHTAEEARRLAANACAALCALAGELVPGVEFAAEHTHRSLNTALLIVSFAETIAEVPTARTSGEA